MDPDGVNLFYRGKYCLLDVYLPREPANKQLDHATGELVGTSQSMGILSRCRGGSTTPVISQSDHLGINWTSIILIGITLINSIYLIALNLQESLPVTLAGLWDEVRSVGRDNTVCAGRRS